MTQMYAKHFLSVLCIVKCWKIHFHAMLRFRKYLFSPHYLSQGFATTVNKAFKKLLRSNVIRWNCENVIAYFLHLFVMKEWADMCKITGLYFFPLGLSSSMQLRSKIIGFTDGLKYSCPYRSILKFTVSSIIFIFILIQNRLGCSYLRPIVAGRISENRSSWVEGTRWYG